VASGQVLSWFGVVSSPSNTTMASPWLLLSAGCGAALLSYTS
jgi:hypothetical protein